MRRVNADWTHVHVSLFPSELAVIPETINHLLNDPKNNSTKEKSHHSILVKFLSISFLILQRS